MKLRALTTALLLTSSLTTTLPAQAQSTKISLITQLNSCIYANTQGAVTPQCVNAFIQSLIASVCGVAQASDCPLPTGVVTSLSVASLTGLGAGVLTALQLPTNTGAGFLAGSQIGTSGATIPLNSGNNTESGAWTFQGRVTLPAGAAANGVYNVLDPQWGAGTGTGGDDSAAINAAIAAAATNAGTGGVVYFPPPPSGAYSVCASPVTFPTAAYNSITLVGSGSGGNPIRVLPGCASGIQTVVNDPPKTFTTPATASRVRMAMRDLRLDSYCIAPHTFTSAYDPGFNAQNVVFRNAAGGYDASGVPSSNVYVAGGYEGVIDATNRAENINDTGHICYSHPTDFPAYNVLANADDWQFGIVGIGAEIANYAAIGLPGNIFANAHGWGYGSGNTDLQTVSQPMFTILTRGYQIITSLEADSPIIAGGRAQITPGSAQVANVTNIVAGGSGGTPNAVVTLTGTTGTGTKFQAVGYTNNSGSLAGVVYVTNGGNYSANPSNLNNEPVTSTASLTGAALKIVMGTGTWGGDSPSINGMTMEGVLAAGTVGWQVGGNLNKFMLTNGQFEYLNNSGSCLVVDVGALSADAVVFGNVNCAFSQVPSGLGLPNGIPVNMSNAAGAYGQVLNSNSSNDLYIGDIAGAFNGALHVRTNGVDRMTFTAAGAPALTALPSSAGGGGLTVCVDTVGALYKKATCP